jgi:hypothetical protein
MPEQTRQLTVTRTARTVAARSGGMERQSPREEAGRPTPRCLKRRAVQDQARLVTDASHA